MISLSPALRLIEFWQSPEAIPPHLLDRAKLDAVSRLDTFNSIRELTALLRGSRAR